MIKSPGLILLFAMLAGCQTGPRSMPDPSVHHVVCFSLKDPGEASALVADCVTLRGIPGVDSCHAGTPRDFGRNNVDANYDVGLYVALRSDAAYREYLRHPIHDRLVEKWRPRVEGVIHARHKGMLEVILGEMLEHKRLFDQAAEGRRDLIGTSLPINDHSGNVMPVRFVGDI